MKRYLYLDDERQPKTDLPWSIVRSYEDATDFIRKNDIPDYISFDHDLGTGPTGYDFVKWLVEQDMDNRYLFPKGFKFNVHSANPVGSKNIHEYLTNYLNYKKSCI